MVPYGGFWWRVLAFVIDAFVLQVVASVLTGILGVSLLPLDGLGAPREFFATGAAFGIMGSFTLVHWLYFALLESSPWQGTLGKLAVGLVVTDREGYRISFLRATGRYFAKFLSSAILCIGFIMVALTGRKQGLHDLIAGTLVYRTRDPRAVMNDERVFA